MEKLTIEQALNEISNAYANLENDKEAFRDKVKSVIDAYFGKQPAGPMPKDEKKRIIASQRTEAKNLKKLAKAMMKGAKEEAKEEADNMTSLIESLG